MSGSESNDSDSAYVVKETLGNRVFCIAENITFDWPSCGERYQICRRETTVHYLARVCEFARILNRRVGVRLKRRDAMPGTWRKMQTYLI